MPKINAIKIKPFSGESAPSSTYAALYKVFTAPVNLYTNVKDSLRTINKKAPSQDEIKKNQGMIKKLLITMHVNFEIQKQVLENVENAKTLEELIRARKILKVLHNNGLSGAAADQFFLGGHFRIRDGGKLFAQLDAIKGAEPRFSSHFPKSRIEEKGISAGRIFPEVLLLKTSEGGKIYSHFQAEASPWRQVTSGGLTNYVPNLQTLQTMEHIYDSAIYFSAKKIAEYRGQTVHNRSNYGWSPFADNNPITSMSRLSKKSQLDDYSREREKEVTPSPATMMAL